MIHAQAGQPFEALAEHFEPDLVGQITVEVFRQADGSQVIAPTTAGITEPRPGLYRVSLTVADVGEYMVRWTDPNAAGPEDDQHSDEPLVVTAVSAITPTVVDLSAIMRARTRDEGGRELGFSEQTRPTASEVVGLIVRAEGLVKPRLGTVPESMNELARSIVALRAAMAVEASYFPEDTSGEESAYIAYRDELKDALEAYDAAIDRDKGATPVMVASAPMKSATRLAWDALEAEEGS